MYIRWIQLFILALLTAALGLAGCVESSGVVVPADDDDVADDDDDDDDDDTVDTSMWDGSELVVHSPVSGTFVPLSDPMHLEGEVIDADGESTDFDEIVWTTNQDEGFEYIGAIGDVEDFPVGEHVIKATAELPNGDRLTYAVGGVLVQHEYAGVYSGTVNINIDMEFQGYPISANCVGATDFLVDPYGEMLEGSGACIASVMGMLDLDVSLIIEGEIYGELVDGTISIDVAGWFEMPATFNGEFVASDELTASFEYDYSGVGIAGSIDAHRVALTP